MAQSPTIASRSSNGTAVGWSGRRRKGRKFELSTEDVAELQAEGIQYYHRYIALFQLQDYLGVIRDTQRNLEMFEFVAKHTTNEELAWSVVQFTPYVRMMNTRAKASLAIEREDLVEAVRLIEKGIDKIKDFYQEQANPEMAEQSPELSFLSEWLQEVRDKRPLTKIERMQREMDEAIKLRPMKRQRSCAT
jgi:hypothetical protein